MDDKEGIAVADVVLDPSRKRSPNDPPVCTGIGISDLTIGGAEGAKEVADSQASGKESYDSNPVRKAKALAISGKPRIFLLCASPDYCKGSNRFLPNHKQTGSYRTGSPVSRLPTTQKLCLHPAI
jgi:hypothetical protein